MRVTSGCHPDGWSGPSHAPGVSAVHHAGGVTPDENRWSEALSLLDGNPPEAAQRRLRRARRLQMLVLVLLVAAGVGALFALDASAGAESDSDDEPLWRSLTGLVVLLAGIVVALPAGVRQLREGLFRDAWYTPLMVLRMSQRRHLDREVMGRIPADPAHLRLARHLAETVVRQELEPKVRLGLTLLVIGQLIISLSWWWVAVLLVLAVSRPAMARRTRRARAFLDAHSEHRAA